VGFSPDKIVAVISHFSIKQIVPIRNQKVNCGNNLRKKPT
jgi:hypothetical protein